MPMGKGARITKKGKFFIVNLVMSREGSNKGYDTPYGTYMKLEEAKKQCWRLNRVMRCGKECLYIKDCTVGGGSGY